MDIRTFRRESQLLETYHKLWKNAKRQSEALEDCEVSIVFRTMSKFSEGHQLKKKSIGSHTKQSEPLEECHDFGITSQVLEECKTLWMVNRDDARISEPSEGDPRLQKNISGFRRSSDEEEEYRISYNTIRHLQQSVTSFGRTS